MTNVPRLRPGCLLIEATKMTKPTLKTIKKIPRLPRRKSDSHKGDFGRILIIGGSRGMIGAPALAASAALRAGAGLVKMVLPDTIQLTSAALEPCATSLALPDTAAGTFSSAAISKIISVAKAHDVIAIGPGLGQSAALVKLLTAVIALPGKPVVIDADGLNNLARIRNWPSKIREKRAKLILTPHPGEAKRLWSSLSKSAYPRDRRTAALALARACRQIIVLKGAGTIVTDGSRVYTNTTGNPGLATGGTGDVLIGIIAALVGQHLDLFDSAVLGVYLHGRAGDLAAEMVGQVSLMATDLLDVLPDAFRQTR